LVSPKGKRIRLSIRSYWHSLTGKEVLGFLQHILTLVSGPIILVWDRHPIHKRLHMFYFPVAAPELNPAEFIWSQISQYLAGTAPHNGKELQKNVFSAVAPIRGSQKRLQACLLGSHLCWFD